MSGNKKFFLSVVSREFLAYRELLTGDLKRPALDVAVQEDFIVTSGSTLEKLDDYIRACDGVIHLIGKASGAVPEEPAVAALLKRCPDFATKLPALAPLLTKPQPGFSYTQWEAYLALYHGRPLFVYLPTDFEQDALTVPRDSRFIFSVTEVQAQREHHQRICDLGHDRGRFSNEERLSSAVLRDLVEILPRLETSIDVAPTRLRHTAERLIGRDEDLAWLDAAWNDPHKNVVVVRAFGGMGKTSLEYFGQRLRAAQPEAWRAAHRRLYEHLCATTKDKPSPTLEDLQPLYHAVAHGCQGGMSQEACNTVYRDRICRQNLHYALNRLGALGSNLGAIACFFRQPWSELLPALTDSSKAWLLNEAASHLRGMGRLTEALEPMHAALAMGDNLENFHALTACSCNMAEIELAIGDIAASYAEVDLLKEVKGEGKRKRGKPKHTTDEAKKYLDKCRELSATPKYAEAAVAAAIPLLLGYRASEVVDREVRDLDNGGTVLRVPRAKSHAGIRAQELPKWFQPLIARLTAGKKSTERIFPHDRTWLFRQVQRICRLAGVPEISSHGLRGTHADLSLHAHVTALAVSQALGHTSTAVTFGHYANKGIVNQQQQNEVLSVLAPTPPGPEESYQNREFLGLCWPAEVVTTLLPRTFLAPCKQP